MRIEKLIIPVRSGTTILRLYVPSAVVPLPVTVFFHGGGFCIGSLNASDNLCRLLAVHSHSIVVSVDYRLAPEAAFPAGIEDAEDCLRWISQHAATFGGDVTRLAVAGNSSGGNFAAVMAQWAHKQRIKLCHQLLLFPVTDGSCEAASYSAFAKGYFLTSDMMRWFWRNYLIDAAQAHDPRVSPLLQTDFKGLAPATIFTAEFDILRSEGEAYAITLAQANVPVWLKCWKGQIHDFTQMTDYITDANTALREAGEVLRQALYGKYQGKRV
ncbi:alpha/beta hydrolase [Xenorhabdus anantnagensis]|uniref:Alpha/beta hydrolase n=1 Tax=Xenorhabdus anantnagensis TaxID=3025875 RepID=A0ABT5LVW8_9GAMM|nr:alpha/beta hydrolase [Xenorhabdus anantnagensis]MDC9598577.1 alpha/beta hydrolase [Xenorhabdus anantnagensis]